MRKKNSIYLLIISVASIACNNVANKSNNETTKSTENELYPSVLVTTIAGQEKGGFGGDGGLAKNAQLNQPYGIAFDSKGCLLIADKENNCIRKISSQGYIETIAGKNKAGYSGDGGLAVDASLSAPKGIVVDEYNNIYVADCSNHAIRKIDINGIITTIAGNGSQGYSGDNGPANKASLSSPVGITLDNKGNLYIAENGNSTVRKIDKSGIITTIAGNGRQSFSGDNSSANGCGLYSPGGVAFYNNNIYIADSWNKRIRKIDAKGIITTIAGNPDKIEWGHNGPAIDANLANPEFVLIRNEEIYLTAIGSHSIRKITAAGKIQLVAGSFKSESGLNDGTGENALFNAPKGMTFDTKGNLYVADTWNNCIRKIEFQ